MSWMSIGSFSLMRMAGSVAGEDNGEAVAQRRLAGGGGDLLGDVHELCPLSVRTVMVRVTHFIVCSPSPARNGGRSPT